MPTDQELYLFYPSVDHPISLELGATRDVLAECILDDKGVVGGAVDHLIECASFNQVFSTAEVPADFLAERPRVLFDTIKSPGTADPLCNASTWQQDSTSQIAITSPLQLEQILHKVVGASTELDAAECARIVPAIIGKYLRNLELYTLVSDPEGTLMRSTTTPDETQASVDSSWRSGGPWLGSLPANVQEYGKARHLSFWSRTDHREHPWKGEESTILMTTVRDLEEDGRTIALDTALPGALAVFK